MKKDIELFSGADQVSIVLDLLKKRIRLLGVEDFVARRVTFSCFSYPSASSFPRSPSGAPLS
jgi:hypothetical protein